MSAAPLPLAAAAERLRGRPGRPRKGTGGAQAGDAIRVNSGLEAGVQDSESGRPSPVPLTERRLLDVAGLAAYLSMAEDTIRELDASGRLSAARVRVPTANGRELRKVLFDRLAVDRLVVGWSAPA